MFCETELFIFMRVLPALTMLGASVATALLAAHGASRSDTRHRHRFTYRPDHDSRRDGQAVSGHRYGRVPARQRQRVRCERRRRTRAPLPGGPKSTDCSAAATAGSSVFSIESRPEHRATWPVGQSPLRRAADLVQTFGGQFGPRDLSELVVQSVVDVRSVPVQDRVRRRHGCPPPVIRRYPTSATKPAKPAYCRPAEQAPHEPPRNPSPRP